MEQKPVLNSTQTRTQYKHAYVLDSSHSHNDSKIYDFFLYICPETLE